MRWQANPVLLKELRSRMRGARAFVILTITLLVLTALCALVYATIAAQTYYYSPASVGSQVGRGLFSALAIGETVLISFLSPSISAVAISGEDELKTLELLLVTPLRDHTILWGKLAAGAAYVGLLVLGAIPLASLIFLFGGVSPGEMALALGLLGLFVLAFNTLGLFCSVAMPRTGVARGVSLGAVAFLMGGTAVMAATLGTILFRPGGGDNMLLFMLPNPIMAMVSVVSSDVALSGGLPVWAYTAIGFAVWTAAMYGGSLILLHRRRSAELEQRGRGMTLAVLLGMVLLTLLGAVGLPTLWVVLGW